MEKVANIKIVYVTTGTLENAKQISKILVTERLAACCSIVQNVTSIFGWQNSIQERNEYLIIIKTSGDNLNNLENRVLELSVDEVPEILAFPAEEAHGQYYNWLVGSLE